MCLESLAIVHQVSYNTKQKSVKQFNGKVGRGMWLKLSAVVECWWWNTPIVLWNLVLEWIKKYWTNINLFNKYRIIESMQSLNEYRIIKWM